MRYAFVAENRPLFSVLTVCRCLRIHPSGFYAWLKNPLSKRAKEDVRQTELIKKAWKESGKLYGYRKLHDDLLDQGEPCCPNRAARLARLAGVKAQTHAMRSPGCGRASWMMGMYLTPSLPIEGARAGVQTCGIKGHNGRRAAPGHLIEDERRAAK